MRSCLQSIRPMALAGMALLLPWGCQKDLQADAGAKRARTHSGKEVPAVEWTVEFTGSGLGKPTVFTYQQLAVMEMIQLDGVLQQNTHVPDDRSGWRGVPLDKLLEAAEIKPGPVTFTLEAVDGYRIRAKRKHLESAIIALQDGEGRWLAEIGRRRPLKLVPPHATGDFWVRNLDRIVVEPAGDSASSS